MNRYIGGGCREYDLTGSASGSSTGPGRFVRSPSSATAVRLESGLRPGGVSMVAQGPGHRATAHRLSTPVVADLAWAAAFLAAARWRDTTQVLGRPGHPSDRLHRGEPVGRMARAASSTRRCESYTAGSMVVEAANIAVPDARGWLPPTRSASCTDDNSALMAVTRFV